MKNNAYSWLSESEIKPVDKPKLNIQKENILFFDMDGTLVETNFANFLAYKNAIQSFFQTDFDIKYNPIERFNRVSLKMALPNLKESEYEKIIQLKVDNYQKYLSQTKLILPVVEILLEYYKSNTTVLVTNCREDRAFMTLNYHNLTDKFSNIFFRKNSNNGNRINKYKNAILGLGVSAQTIIVFENERLEIENAINAGISNSNILSL